MQGKEYFQNRRIADKISFGAKSCICYTGNG